MRALTAGLEAALDSANMVGVMMCALELDTPVYVHTGVGNIDHDGNTYTGVGELGKIEPIKEGTELKNHGLALSLTGVPNTFVSIALNENYQNKLCRLYLAALNSDYSVIVYPGLVYKGYIDTMSIYPGDEVATVQLVTRSRLAAWDKARMRRYNNADQQARVPGDLGFEYVEELVDRTIPWGQIRV